MKEHKTMYDIIGVGIGPFNLSFAALLENQPELDALFFEQTKKFNWHPGMLIEGTVMQVPFIADLVTMADPKSKYTFLNYVNEHERMYQFYFLQRLDIPRREYNDYCQWVANEINSCKFGKRVVDIRHINGEEHYEVDIMNVETGDKERYRSRHIVMGTGSVPTMPPSFRDLPNEDVFHTAEFLSHQERCKRAESITVIGSGQSAAETFRELLKEQRDYGYRLDWITRSGFASMEESKLSLEHFSPDYVDYFYQLPQSQKEEVFATQDLFYKGISNHTITDIYNLLYENSIGTEKVNVGLRVLSEVEDISKKDEGDAYEIKCLHTQKQERFTHESEVVIAATGYKPYVPDFIRNLTSLLEWDEEGRYKVLSDYRLAKTKDSRNEIYVHSGISHTHGVGSTNLGLAVHRNKVIINHLLGEDVYKIPKKNVFQTFDV
ncbi:SidA/IucD/PvdA family monooxygenase [Pontibacillus yanchengensis]|uniref:SidA/IucD/PvdA family monooxygenase n=2 Tax=Pontibacillus yanchengensis TaxID=462910 RepID=A0ACC7VDZ1_9BACI|nr:SidA/IucD/PvdA family monooxygenase [Pontibacillus yanchengensis]MYL35316.1 SidA/IucD/PvdA family monooxygenase [Pontibacillus yanchengensis]MYL52345.1 SidA/IucD/PvdA family monooxygenase [Pontibacillus yanchengensis]